MENERSTRKSYVVHYSTARHYKSRGASMKTRAVENGQEVWRGVSRKTDRVLVKNGCKGVDNPLRT